MAIIKFDSSGNMDSVTLNTYPDHFISENAKTKEKYWKQTMDYYSNIAYNTFNRNKKEFTRNYDLLKGILKPEDFYDEPETRSFVETLVRDVELPSYVKHYPILNPPLNTMIGELSKRPDVARVKAFDEDSLDEALQFRTDLVHNYIIQDAKDKLISKLSIQGVDIPPEEDVQRMTMEQVMDELVSYTSIAEKWANRTLTSCKVEFNVKEISEDCYRDLLTVSRQFYHIYEDNSKTGLALENKNPKNVWFLTLPDRKYISDPSGGGKGAYAAGIIDIMELSEIIERFDLDKEEIDYLRDSINQSVGAQGRSSNFFYNITGEKSIKYDTYSPLMAQERLLAEASLESESGSLNELLGISSQITSFGSKYVVVQAYFIAKQKVGELTYADKDGELQTTLIDETYKTIPNEVSIKWGYINRWWKGLKIGGEIYKVEPFDMLKYCPIIGVVHEAKNTKARSLVDLMKPLQIIYNVCMNQLFKLLEKEIGVVYKIQLKRIPTPKEGDDGQDAIEMWEEEARRRGVVFEDDSPENIGAMLPNTTTSSAVDLSRTAEIQSRYQLAAMIKNECWELVGITRQRLGGTAGATESATATQSGLSQSYTQTEPYFAQHDYVLNQVYQAIIDGAQYKVLKYPTSTISYIATQGEEVFLRVNTEDLKMRDLKVFVTSRAEDQEIFRELRSLSEAMLQNGTDPYEISVLYSTNSVRQMRNTFKKLKEAKDQMAQQQQQIEQQKVEQQQAQFEATMKKADEDEKFKIANDNYNKQLDRISKEKVAIITTLAKGSVTSDDADSNGVPDVLESAKLDQESLAADRDYQARLLELHQKTQSEANKIKLEQEKLQVDRDNQKNDLQIAKMNAKNRGTKKSK